MKKFRFILVSGKKVKVDREDLERLKKVKWRLTEGTTGRIRVVTSKRVRNKVKTITMGRFLMKPSKGKQVYPRRFNDELDYQKSNLIVCTLKERQRVLPKKRSKTSSVYRGVSLGKKTKKWRAGIEVNGRSINLGDFETENEAARAYNTAARKYFGTLTYQNPIGRKVFKRKG